MQKGFFSFVAITLVALALFIASAYIFTFKDFRNTAQKDLEIRKVSQRMQDARIALNRTLIDALLDAGYSVYGCEAAIPNPNAAADYCDKLNGGFADAYVSRINDMYSDEISLNISKVQFVCANNLGGPPNINYNSWIIPVNFTDDVVANYVITASTPAVSWTDSASYAITADLSHTGLFGIIDSLFAIRIMGLTANSSNINIPGGNYQIFASQCK